MTRPRGAAQNRRVAEILRTVAMKFDKAAEWEDRDPERGEYETRWAWDALEKCLASEGLAVQLWPVDQTPIPPAPLDLPHRAASDSYERIGD